MKIFSTEYSKEKLFKKLYEEYYAPFCLYSKRFINDSSVCEDIVSDVFASLWDKRETIELKPTTALGYLKTCVRNSCLNYLKHQEYEWNYAESYQKQDPIYANGPDSIYTLNELYKMLYQTLDKLPKNYRTVFIKSFFEGKTHVEIALEMDLSVKSIDRYKQKTMELLRHELKEFLPIILFTLFQRYS